MRIFLKNCPRLDLDVLSERGPVIDPSRAPHLAASPNLDVPSGKHRLTRASDQPCILLRFCSELSKDPVYPLEVSIQFPNVDPECIERVAEELLSHSHQIRE